MPLYEYRCRACDNVFEYIQTLSEGPKRKCETCAGRLDKLVSRAGFVLKGKGWYETDFKGKAPETTKSEPSSPKSGGASESSKDSSSKKDGKSAPKKESKGSGKDSSASSGGKD